MVLEKRNGLVGQINSGWETLKLKLRIFDQLADYNIEIPTLVISLRLLNKNSSKGLLDL